MLIIINMNIMNIMNIRMIKKIKRNINIACITNNKNYKIMSEIDWKWLEKARNGWNRPWSELCLTSFPLCLAVVIWW